MRREGHPAEETLGLDVIIHCPTCSSDSRMAVEWCTQRGSDARVEGDRQRQKTLDDYLSWMTDLILKDQLNGATGRIAQTLARTKTLTALHVLDGDRKAQVLQFLYEAALIGAPPKVNLNGADLRGANLDEATLAGAELRGVQFSKATFRGANLSGALLLGSDFRHADFSRANLECARLNQASLVGANFQDARVAGVDIEDADMRNASSRSLNSYEEVSHEK